MKKVMVLCSGNEARELNLLAKPLNRHFLQNSVEKEDFEIRFQNWQNVQRNLEIYKIQNVQWRMDSPHVWCEKNGKMGFMELVPMEIYDAEFVGYNLIKII